MIPRIALLFALPLAAGCGGSGAVPVSGRVTLDDKPLANVHVSFQPIAAGQDKNPGGGSYAITDADGRYSLRLVEGDRPGAFAGKHRVEITARNESDDDSDRRGRPAKPRVSVPAKFNRNSDLTCEVPSGGTADANFDLKSR